MSNNCGKSRPRYGKIPAFGGPGPSKMLHTYTSVIPYKGSQDAFIYETTTRKVMPQTVKTDGMLGRNAALVIAASGEDMTAARAAEQHNKTAQPLTLIWRISSRTSTTSKRISIPDCLRVRGHA
jgi:hypothetical protein